MVHAVPCTRVWTPAYVQHVTLLGVGTQERRDQNIEGGGGGFVDRLL